MNSFVLSVYADELLYVMSRKLLAAFPKAGGEIQATHMYLHRLKHCPLLDGLRRNPKN